MNKRVYVTWFGPCGILLLLSVVFLAATVRGDEPVLQEELFVGGRDGYHTYRIPSLIVTTNGTVLAFCEGRKRSASDTGDVDVLVKRSTDGGRTWSAQQVVWDDGANTCGNPCPVVDSETGTICLLLTHNDGGVRESQIVHSESPSTRTVWISRSADDGKTWSTPANITSSAKDPAWGWYATGPGVGVQIHGGPRRGRLVIPCDHTILITNGAPPRASVQAGSHVIYSDDHGFTWTIGGIVRPDVNECQVVELADERGGLLLNMRNYGSSRQRAQSRSLDGGQTWTAAERHPELLEPRCQASILRYSWPEQGQPGRILFSNPAATNRTNMTVRVSRRAKSGA